MGSKDHKRKDDRKDEAKPVETESAKPEAPAEQGTSPSAPAAPPPAAEQLSAKVDELTKALAESQAKVDELTKTLVEAQAKIDALQRQAADLDNRRKRVERMAEESAKYALQDLALAVLPVIDNFERALSHTEETAEAQALHEGLKLVHDQLLTVLGKFNVQKIEALGQPFDPHRHEAIAQAESTEHPEQTVIDVQQAGYLLHDRLLRPASVVVSRKPAAAADESLTEDEQE